MEVPPPQPLAKFYADCVTNILNERGEGESRSRDNSEDFRPELMVVSNTQKVGRVQVTRTGGNDWTVRVIRRNGTLATPMLSGSPESVRNLLIRYWVRESQYA